MQTQASTNSEVAEKPKRRFGHEIGKHFPKGVSGNPSGRPKSDVGALARLHTAEAIAALVKCLNDPKHAVAAAVAILDRGYGKPQQTVENNVNITVRADELSDDELARLVGVGASRSPKVIEGNANNGPQTLPSRDAVDVLPNDVNDLG